MADMEEEMMLFYDRQAPKVVHQRHLPHWNQAGRMYFVTFRLADSIPADRAAALRRERMAWRKIHSEPYSAAQWREYHQLFSARVERWLDHSRGTCILADPRCARIVIDAMETFDGQRYCLDEWVIMPNHVHVLVKPASGFELSRILHAWKSFTAHAINRYLGRCGQLWQRESFDHLVRSAAHLDRFRRYIRENPAKAGGFRDRCTLRLL
jgi:REP element-mobilizing transposase RayT